MIEKNEIGQALPKETWNTVADHLQEAAVPLSSVLRRINFEGQGESDAEDFLAEMQLAITAMRYVAEFATDKCRFITIPEGENVQFLQ